MKKQMTIVFLFLIWILSFTTVCSAAGLTGTDGSTPVPLEEAAEGDTVLFGKYEDNTEWIVLERRGGNLLLLSKYAIEKRNYADDGLSPATWEISAIRSWLNGTYLETAFTKEERDRIMLSKIINADNCQTDGGNDTEDFIFLLSLDEADAYFPSREERKALLNAGNTVDFGSAVSWMLRSPGCFSNDVALVSPDGSVSYQGSFVDSFYGIRPALWVRVSPEPEAEKLNKEQYRNASVGDIVKFGHYNGHREWIVLEKQENRMLLLSRYLLMPVQYYPEFSPVTWETSTLRTWLNETYLNYAFSAEEQAMILTASVPNPPNEELGTDGGAKTKDRIFILSSQELTAFFPASEDRVAGSSDKSPFHYWVRTPGSNNKRAAFVDRVGLIGYHGDSVNYAANYIRPALWLDLSE